MTDPLRTANGTHPKQELERLARNLRLRLEGEGRAGLAAVGRIPETAPRAPERAPRAPEPGAVVPGDA